MGRPRVGRLVGQSTQSVDRLRCGRRVRVAGRTQSCRPPTRFANPPRDGFPASRGDCHCPRCTADHSNSRHRRHPPEQSHRWCCRQSTGCNEAGHPAPPRLAARHPIPTSNPPDPVTPNQSMSTPEDCHCCCCCCWVEWWCCGDEQWERMIWCAVCPP